MADGFGKSTDSINQVAEVFDKNKLVPYFVGLK